MTCACGCGRAWRPLNPRAQFHPECNRQPVRLRLVRTAAHRRAVRAARLAEAQQIEAMFQAARAARKRAA